MSVEQPVLGPASLERGLVAMIDRGWYTNHGLVLAALEARVDQDTGWWCAGLCSRDAALAALGWALGRRLRSGERGEVPEEVLVQAWSNAAAPSGEASYRREAPATVAQGADQSMLEERLVELLSRWPTDVWCVRVDGQLEGVVLDLAEPVLWEQGEVWLFGGLALVRTEEVGLRLRTIRNHHTNQTFARVPIRFNLKMSEAQAIAAVVALFGEEAAESPLASRMGGK